MPKELAFFNKTHEIWLGRCEGLFVCRLLHAVLIVVPYWSTFQCCIVNATATHFVI